MIKQMTVFRALLKGVPVTFQGYKHRLFSPGETVVFPSGAVEITEFFLGIEMTKKEGDYSSTVYIGSDISFRQILNTAEKMTLREITNLKKEIQSK